MEAKLQIRLSQELKDKTLEKADREAINVSQLLRNFLTEWVEEEQRTHKQKGARS